MVDPVLSLAAEYSHILAPPGEWSSGVKKARVLYIVGWVAILRLCAFGLYIELCTPWMASMQKWVSYQFQTGTFWDIPNSV